MVEGLTAWYRRFIARAEERGRRKHGDLKREHPFRWGLEHLEPSGGAAAGDASPLERLRSHVRAAMADTDAYFRPGEVAAEEIALDGKTLSFPSPVESGCSVNDTARARYRPVDGAAGAVVLVTHWNTSGDSTDRVARLLNMVGVSTLRLVHPYHEERGEGEAKELFPELPSAAMVSADVGRTLQAVRQSVADALTCVDWLAGRYDRIGALGASIGSCIAFLAAAHDPRITAVFLNHFSSYFGKVVWRGKSTRHVRESIEGHLDEEELTEVWLPHSPIAFVDRFATVNPEAPVRVISGRYDETFPFELTRIALDALEDVGVELAPTILPCGHYTLGRYWFKYYDAWQMLKFFRGRVA